MAPDPTKVAYLRQFYDEAEITAFWKALGDTQRDFAEDPLQIVSHSEAGESSAAIKVTDAPTAELWMASCQEALRLEGTGENLPKEALGRSTDWSSRQTRA